MPKRRLEPEDVVGFKTVADPQVSPDGELVAFVLGDSFIVDTKLPRSNVWVVPTAGGDASPLTNGPRTDSTPRWSPDGETLAFLSDRDKDGELQIHLLPRAGGEAARLTSTGRAVASGRGADSIAWSPDGRQIAFIATDPETDDERRRREEKDDAIEFEKDPKFTRLYVVDVDSGTTARVSPEGLHVWEFCWSADGNDFAVVASDLPFEQDWYTCRLAAFSRDGGPVRTLHFSHRQVARPTWSPNGLDVAFLTSNWSDRGINHGSVYVVTAGGHIRDLSEGHVASVHSLAWAGDSDRILTVAHERGGAGVAEIDVATGERTPLWHGEALLAEAGSALSVDRAGNVVSVLQGAATPPDLVLGKRNGDALEWTRLTDQHPEAGELEIGATEEVHWKGADDWDIQGLLIRPAGETEAGRHPLVTVVHGGPTGVSPNQYYPAHRYAQLLAARGVAVFLPNYRGSTGWGLEFSESNIGDIGGKDWEDIQHGIDYCIQIGIADPGRLGIVGGSYGGFMTAWAVTQTERFKAAVMIAGISDWRSFHGRSRISDWDAIHYGDADPWDPDGVYRRFSPITHVKRVRTPTLIVHGEVDRDVPVEQAYMFYRALKELGQETELVVYPREPHGFKERTHIIDMYRRVTNWFSERL